MQITYLGHSAFKLKGTTGVVVMDPYDSSVGFEFPRVLADMVTISHNHKDHNAYQNVFPTTKRDKPFIVSQSGEYEVSGISVFGTLSYHDDNSGLDRGTNIIYTVFLDGLRICHLGDLGHELTASQADSIGNVDVLFCPVGGVYTINPVQAVNTIRKLEPSYVIPMHYRTDFHDKNQFGQLASVDDFLKVYGVEAQPVASLEISAGRLPEETEICQLVAASG